MVAPDDHAATLRRRDTELKRAKQLAVFLDPNLALAEAALKHREPYFGPLPIRYRVADLVLPP